MALAGVPKLLIVWVDLWEWLEILGSHKFPLVTAANDLTVLDRGVHCDHG